MKANYYFIILICLCGLCTVSCTRDEFQPEPVGEAVPYEPEEYPLLSEELQQNGHSLFLAAWEKSTLNDSLSAWENTPLTLLVPSDKAFEEAGYTLQQIQALSIAQIDTLLQYLCLEFTIDTLKNPATAGNIKVKTKLLDPVIQTSENTPMVYPHYVGITGNTLFVNGRNVGEIRHRRVEKAHILYSDCFFRKPEKDMWTYLKEDGRFTQYIRLIELCDGTYGNRMPEAQMRPILSVDRGATRGMIQFLSLFAPTDEAFEKAGYTASRLNRLNLYFQKNIGIQQYIPYAFESFLKSDSIMSYHSWGIRYLPVDQMSPAGKRNPTLFFSNDLNTDLLGNYLLQVTGWKPVDHPAMPVPFLFERNEEGVLTLRLKNAASGTESATVIEPDVMTFNGPIHVVDRLFIPEGF